MAIESDAASTVCVGELSVGESKPKVSTGIETGVAEGVATGAAGVVETGALGAVETGLADGNAAGAGELVTVTATTGALGVVVVCVDGGGT